MAGRGLTKMCGENGEKKMEVVCINSRRTSMLELSLGIQELVAEVGRTVAAMSSLRQMLLTVLSIICLRFVRCDEVDNTRRPVLISNDLPSHLSGISATIVENNLAVIPREWESGAITDSLHDLKTATDNAFSDALAQIKQSDFVVWDRSFLDLIGPQGKIERIQSFPEEEHRVHEAPAYIPETNELLFSDTDITGWLWLVNVDTHETRKLHTDPPLNNVNGATYRDGSAYVATNGGNARGLYRLNVTSGKAEAILNNYRGRRFNSPNDLIFDTQGNILFTDPTYGYSKWPGVQPPELPKTIYHFNPRTGAIVALSNSVVDMPNGLALSRDESTLYVADSASTPVHGGGLQSQRNVWAFDYRGTTLSNPRVIYQAESGWPDGIRATANGYLMIAVAGGVDVIDPSSGLYLGKINTPDDIIFNLQAAVDKAAGVWLLTGLKHIYKVTMSEGPAKTASARAAEMGGSLIDVVKSYVGGSKEEL